MSAQETKEAPPQQRHEPEKMSPQELRSDFKGFIGLTIMLAMGAGGCAAASHLDNLMSAPIPAQELADTTPGAIAVAPKEANSMGLYVPVGEN